MTSLHDVPGFLAATMRAKPHLTLAQAAAWLDPAHFFESDELEDAWYDAADDTLLLQAVSIARRCLPRAYAEVVRAVRQGATFDEVEQVFCAAFSAAFPHMDLSALEDVYYGVPLSFLGVDPESTDFPRAHPRLARVLTDDFGLALSGDRYHAFGVGDLASAAYIAECLGSSLSATGTQPHADLLLLLGWLFGTSGNSIVDWTAEQWYDAGFEPLYWEPQELALADEVHAEAGLIVDAGLRALDHLDMYPDMRRVWRENIARTRRAKERNLTDVRLTWPDWIGLAGFADGDPGRAASDAALLLVWHSAGEEDG